jgi:predicted transcriptional regulator
MLKYLYVYSDEQYPDEYKRERVIPSMFNNKYHSSMKLKNIFYHTNLEYAHIYLHVGKGFFTYYETLRRKPLELKLPKKRRSYIDIIPGLKEKILKLRLEGKSMQHIAGECNLGYITVFRSLKKIKEETS